MRVEEGISHREARSRPMKRVSSLRSVMFEAFSNGELIAEKKIKFRDRLVHERERIMMRLSILMEDVNNYEKDRCSNIKFQFGHWCGRESGRRQS